MWVALLAGTLWADAASGSTVPRAPLDPPVEPFVAAHLFDRPETPWGPGHRGVDIVAAVGSPVVAPADGTVSVARLVVDRGVITVVHDSGLATSLEPVEPIVSEGERVTRGQVIGYVAATPGHCAPATCVHWGVRERGDYLNPLDVLAGFGRVRLLA